MGLFALFVAVGLVGSRLQSEAAAVYDKVKNAVVVVVTDDGLASGFAIGDGTVIVTAKHTVKGAITIRVLGSAEAEVTHVAYDPVGRDLALLKTSKHATTSTIPLETSWPEPGENIYVVGAPLGLEKTLSTGIVSALRTTDISTWVQHTAAVSKGSSGSPVLNAKGHAVAVVVGKLTEGEAINFALASTHVRTLFDFAERSSGVYVPLPSISPRFDFAGVFSEGLGRVKVGDRWGFIDKTGKMVIAAQFDFARDFSEGLARVQVGGKYGFIDKTGKMVIAAQFDNAWYFSEGLAAVKVGTKWGFIDKTGKMVIAGPK